MSQTNTPTSYQIIPSGLNWTPERAKQLAVKHRFMHVSSKQDYQPTPRTITGAVKGWNKVEDTSTHDIFIINSTDGKTPIRLTGTPNDVASALGYAGFDQYKVNDLWINAITSSNYNTTHSELYDSEKDAYNKLVGNKNPNDVVSALSHADIMFIAANLNGAVKINKRGLPLEVAGNSGPAPKVATNRTKTLHDKYHSLKDGKILDLSSYNIQRNIGGKPVNDAAKPRGGKVRAPSMGLRLLTDSGDKFEHAIKEIFGEEGLTQYAEDIQAVHDKFSQDNTTNGAEPSAVMEDVEQVVEPVVILETPIVEEIIPVQEIVETIPEPVVNQPVEEKAPAKPSRTRKPAVKKVRAKATKKVEAIVEAKKEEASDTVKTLGGQNIMPMPSFSSN